MQNIAEPKPRLIDATTSRQREVLIVAALLDDCGQHQIGPNISTALAYAPEWWEDVQARTIACAIKRCISVGRPITDPSVAEYLCKEDRDWLFNPSFNGMNAVPLSTAEYEAYDLVVRYRGKRLTRIVGDSWVRMKSNPEQAHEIAMDLKKQLEEF